MSPVGRLARDINLRDVAGLRVEGGGVVASGRLYRSGHLDHLRLSERQALLEELGVTDIVDLRHRTGCYDGVTVTRHTLPLVPLGTKPVLDPADTYESVADWYLRQLTIGTESLRRIVELVATSDGATLIHCHAGKDRTGSVVAVILSAVGVTREDVVADYARTGTVEGDAFLDALPPKFAESHPDTMSHLLDKIERKFGSGLGFIEAIGVEGGVIRKLRERLVREGD